MAISMPFPEFRLFEEEPLSLSTNQVMTFYSKTHGVKSPVGEVNETEGKGWNLFTILSLFLYSFVSVLILDGQDSEYKTIRICDTTVCYNKTIERPQYCKMLI